MRIKVTFVLLCLNSLIFFELPAIANENIALYSSRQAAQRHCPSDEVVWLNTKNNTYYSQSAKLYAKTKPGAYVCKKEAEAARKKCCTGEQPPG